MPMVEVQPYRSFSERRQERANRPHVGHSNVVVSLPQRGTQTRHIGGPHAIAFAGGHRMGCVRIHALPD
jgi:hypothetical protein